MEQTQDAHGKSLNMVLEAEFYCQNCKDFRDVRHSDPDILCDSCDFVIATYRTREVIARAKS
ncbi:MAG: hypothetical protein A2Y74_01480 [Actinobacteria bacterium RBG_13_63_9]|nr:MAG: hypothetical protein A2Y74_01480 [Actinobacteria bacterium RBG_13_63_9]